MFNLATDGDILEQKGHTLFLKDKFPSYEIFWQNFIVQLTNRPIDIYTKTDLELQKIFPSENIEKIHERIAILQLHYSVFRMLLRAYEMIKNTAKDWDAIETFFSSICSALDISAELFGRYERIKNNTPIVDDPFNSLNGENNSLKIRKDWQKRNPYPAKIKYVRHYRNLMLHGQMFGSMITPGANLLIIPKPDMIEKYLDWRSVGPSFHSNAICDFLHSINITSPIFVDVIGFLEEEWKKNLIRK